MEWEGFIFWISGFSSVASVTTNGRTRVTRVTCTWDRPSQHATSRQHRCQKVHGCHVEMCKIFGSLIALFLDFVCNLFKKQHAEITCLPVLILSKIKEFIIFLYGRMCCGFHSVARKLYLVCDLCLGCRLSHFRDQKKFTCQSLYFYSLSLRVNLASPSFPTRHVCWAFCPSRKCLRRQRRKDQDARAVCGRCGCRLLVLFRPLVRALQTWLKATW